MINEQKIFIKVIALFFLCPVFLLTDFSGAQVLENNLQPAGSTKKTIDITLYKKNNLYKIVGSRVYLGESYYFSSYEQFKNDRSDGRIISFKGITLGYFPIDNNLIVSLCSDGVDEAGNMVGGCQKLSEGEVLIQMPYFPNGKLVEIYSQEGKKVLTIDLSSKAICNENGKCDGPVEDGENCPQDCKNNFRRLRPARRIFRGTDAISPAP